ncbi:hypothetical protein NHX12_023722 [Muraenolepis orangiensis]|uniref:Uncharacterized protein n=1 Tax=Muraenolepis orangiensis TaxID=630683 RepID=A0A9Q0EP58_9TELE|nr:hypothetical protein NHX12_023722 [Muraenolepis orangiensis]
MPRLDLLLEALSALTGCRVEATEKESQLNPQDIVNIAALKQFYKREGLHELEYPSLGALSLRDEDEEQDMYSSPGAIQESPPGAETRPLVKINPDTFFDSRFNYDFTNIKDGEKTFSRGEESYVRPCGWSRVALQVLGRYEDGDAWLDAGPAAWPVSYHGNRMDGALGITATPRPAGEGPAKKEGEGPASLGVPGGPVAGPTHGRGVYSSPSVSVAESHCVRFRSHGDGKMYKVALQNRINPLHRKECQRKGYWLVLIPQEYSPTQTRAAVQDALRPYGMLLKEE